MLRIALLMTFSLDFTCEEELGSAEDKLRHVARDTSYYSCIVRLQ